MKKIALLVCVLCLIQNSAVAQMIMGDEINGTPVAQSNDNPSEAVSSGNYRDAFDLMYNYSSDTESSAIGLGWDTGQRGYFTLGAQFGGGKNMDIFSMSLGYGLRKRYVSNDMFLVQGKLYPYMGYFSSSYKINGMENKSSDFNYGLSGSLALGLKLWNTANGNSVFLTAGYSVSAPDFKFKGMFESGSFGLAITIIYY